MHLVTQQAIVIHGSYDYRMVALSVVLAFMASYAALALAGRLRESKGPIRFAWLAGGAVAMGLGIWSMHYIGMLAYSLPIKVLYDWPTVLLSLLCAVLASGIALWIGGESHVSLLHATGGGILMGGGIASMHFIGMEAMRMHAMCIYSAPLVGLSVFLAIAISWVALWLTFRVHERTAGRAWRKLYSAVLMGLAIPVMHYTGMAAATFVAMGSMGSAAHAFEISSRGITIITYLSATILGLTILSSVIDRRLSVQAFTFENLRQDAVSARRSLAATEERLRLTMRSSGIAIWNWEIEPDLIDADESCARLFGLSLAEFPHSVESFSTLIHPDDRQRVYREITTTLGGAEYDTEFRTQWRDGTVRRIASRGKVYLNEDRSPLRLTGISWDVTERRLIEEKLRAAAERLASESKFRQLLEAAPDAVIVLNRQGEISFVNSQAEKLFGYAKTELLGQSIEILMPFRLRKTDPHYCAALFVDPQMRDRATGLELSMLRKDHSELATEISLSPMETEDGILISAAIRDITERKRSEEQILRLNRQLEEAAAAAESANRAKSIFLSTMSHEIRTPMNAILGYTQLMLRDTNLASEAIANLKIIGRSGEHLLALINDILDMSKIEAGRVELNPTAFSLSIMLDDLSAMFRLRAEAKALSFEMSVGGEARSYLIADEGKLRQALINLLGNATKFTERGSVRLLVHVRKDEHDGLWLSACVEDTGPGITNEQLKRLFEPFSQLKNNLNTHEGTGLGLAISRNFARLMGGDLTVESEPGVGSKFTLEVPVQAAPHGMTTPKNPICRVIRVSAGGDAPRILVVDDRFENRDWLTKLLSSLGFSVRSSDNGQTAVSEWQEWNPDLILMDVHMPVMDGLEATRIIKSSPRGKATVVVALTASALEEDRQTISASGADDFLAKPCSQSALLETIQTHFNVRYDYEPDSHGEDSSGGVPALTAEKLKVVPARFQHDLLAAIKVGNKELLDGLIFDLRDYAAADLPDALQQLADNYEYDQLTRLLQEVLDDGPAAAV